jgi:esterase/lipase superfamily enzyme
MASVTVYFATNRQPITGGTGQAIVDFGSEPGPIDGLAVRFGSVQADVEDGKAQLVQSSLVVAEETLTGPEGFEPQHGSKTIFEALRQAMIANKRETLVFVHGFSNSFKDAMERAAGILDFYGIPANIFAFTWPSRASPVGVPLPYADYEHDRQTAAASGPAMARTLGILYDYVDNLAREQRCEQQLHLLCHSMGNYAFRNALQALLRSPIVPRDAGNAPRRLLTAVAGGGPDPSALRRTFDQIVLAAADEDEDAFDDPNKLKYVSRLGNAVTVYHTRRDWILSTLSAVTKFNGPRLGNSGPDNMDSISDKVTAVDVSEVISPASDPESHQYYRIFPAVRDDIVAVLSDEKPPKREQLQTGRWRIVP